MKKILVVLLTILALTISVTNVKADRRLGESAFINDNGVMIFKKDYTKLVQLGLLNDEIKLLTQDELDRYLSYDIDAKVSKKYFIKTEYPVIDGNVVAQQIPMTEEDFFLEYAERQAALNNETTTTDTGTMSAMAAISNEATDTSNLNIFTVTVTYDGCKGTFGEFLVKTNMEWLFQPTQRYEDISAVTFSSGVAIKKNLKNGVKVPEFTNKIIYMETLREFDTLNQNYTTTLTQKTNIIDYNNTSNYKVDVGSFASKIDLPDDKRPSPEVSYIYSNFLVTLDTTLVATTSITAAEVVGMYTHQYGNGAFDWNDVILSAETPYFTYIDNFFIDDVNYEPPFVGELNFTGIYSGHQFTITNDSIGHTLTCSECGYSYYEDHILYEEVCTVCGYVAHVHDFISYAQFSATDHKATCYCGEIVSDPHLFNWVTTTVYHYRKCLRCYYRTPNQSHIFVTVNGMRFCSVCGYGSGIIQYSLPLNIQ